MKHISKEEAYQLAQKKHQEGKIAEAEQLYQAVIDVDQHNAEATHYLGLIKAGRGELNLAIELLKKSVELDSQNPYFHNNLGEIYRQLGQMEHAEFHISSACELKPGYSDALSNLGLLFKTKGMINEAKFCFAEALSSDPQNFNALINTGNLFMDEDAYEDAAQCYEAALQISPDNPVALASAGRALYEMGDYNTAAKYISRLVNNRPDLHADKVNLALITLRNKDFRKGFQLYEARFDAIGTMEGERDTLWRGTNLKGKTLYIYNEKQGLSGYGDTIMFARYLKELDKYEPEKVIFRVQPELVSLLKDNLPEYVEVTSGSTENYDVHSPLLSVPFVLNARAKTIPHVEGYIKADDTKTFDEIANCGKIKIGIAFQTSRQHLKHQQRTIAQDAFAPLYENDNVQLFYISKEEPQKELDSRIIDMRPHMNDFADTAAIISQMDMIITADTSVVHLAGALGKRTELLLNHFHDWRWFSAKEGKKSEWYSSVTFHIKENDSSWIDTVSSIKI